MIATILVVIVLCDICYGKRAASSIVIKLEVVMDITISEHFRDHLGIIKRYTNGSLTLLYFT